MILHKIGSIEFNRLKTAQCTVVSEISSFVGNPVDKLHLLLSTESLQSCSSCGYLLNFIEQLRRRVNLVQVQISHKSIIFAPKEYSPNKLSFGQKF